jgi:hypothetical protein
MTLEALLTNPRRAVRGNQFKDALDRDGQGSYLAEIEPTPFIHLNDLRRLVLNTLATLWGPLGAHASTAIFGQPLGPPAQLDLAVFTAAQETPSQVPINQCIDFGTATLIPGNTPYPWTQLDPIEPDQKLLDQNRNSSRMNGHLAEPLQRLPGNRAGTGPPRPASHQSKLSRYLIQRDHYAQSIRDRYAQLPTACFACAERRAHSCQETASTTVRATPYLAGHQRPQSGIMHL